MTHKVKKETVPQECFQKYIMENVPWTCPRGVIMNSPLGRNFPNWGKVKKETVNFWNFNFFGNIVWNIFIYVYETELQ